MTIRTIVADVSARLENIVSSLFQSKPAEDPPQPAKNPNRDTYSENFRVQLARNAFREGAASLGQAWAHQSPLLYSPWGLVAIAGCGDEPKTETYPSFTRPKFIGQNKITTPVGQPLDYLAEVVVADGGYINDFTIRGEIPTGLNFIEEKYGLRIQWTPKEDQIGEHEFEFLATDSNNTGSGSYPFTIVVTPAVNDQDAGGDVNDASAPDAGPPIDNDGDGFKSDVDCDDNDTNTFPLKDDQTLSITKDTTICPGTYKRVRINIGNVNGLTIKGSGVILDQDGVYDLNDVSLVGMIHFLNASNNELFGFEIKNFGDSYVGVRMDNSNNNKIHDLNINQVFDMAVQAVFGDIGGGFYLVDSSSNLILSNKIMGKGIKIFIQNGVGNKVGSNEIVYSPSGSGGFDSAIFYSASPNGTIENNTLTGSGIMMGGTTGGTGSILSGNIITQANQGIYVATDNTTINNNKINFCKVGIELSSNNNFLINNDLKNNSKCYNVSPLSTGNTISGNQCN